MPVERLHQPANTAATRAEPGTTAGSRLSVLVLCRYGVGWLRDVILKPEVSVVAGIIRS